MKRITLILAAGATLMAAAPALARQDPASYPRHSMGSPPSLDPAFRGLPRTSGTVNIVRALRRG